MFFINCALKFKYQPNQLKVNGTGRSLFQEFFLHDFAWTQLENLPHFYNLCYNFQLIRFGIDDT